MDEQNTMDKAMRGIAAATRHRLDSGSAANRPQTGPVNGSDVKPAYDGPRADSAKATREMGMVATDAEPRVEYLGFDEALQILRRGGRVARSGWNGRGQFLVLAVGASAYGRGLDAAPIRTHILIRPVDGDFVPWVASQTDLLAFDWCLVREEKVLVYGHGDATGTSDVGG